MKFTCEKSTLAHAISNASHAVAVRSSNTSLEGLLLEAGRDLVLTGYNMEIGIRARVTASVTEPGSVVLPNRLFGDIIRRLPDDIVTISMQDYMVNIKCGMTDYNIMGSTAEEYPSLPDVDCVNRVSMKQSVMKSMISQVLFAVGTDDARPALKGALLEVGEDNLVTMVTVDGYRLALRKEELAEREGLPSFDFIIPSVALSETEKLCKETEDLVTIGMGQRHLSFTFGDITMISRRLDGAFLPYRTAVPWNNPIKLITSKRALQASVERASLIVSEKQSNPLRCLFEDGVLKLSTRTAIGTVYDECPISGSGSGLEIGFNHRYVLDILRACPGEELCLQLNTGVSPMVITAADGSESFLYMVLPVRLRAGQ